MAAVQLADQRSVLAVLAAADSAKQSVAEQLQQAAEKLAFHFAVQSAVRSVLLPEFLPAVQSVVRSVLLPEFLPAMQSAVWSVLLPEFLPAMQSAVRSVLLPEHLPAV